MMRHDSVMVDGNHGMVLRQPATRWQDALPSGNGTVGALVYGHIRHELVVLNHERLWLRTAKPEVPDVSDCLPELRDRLLRGIYDWDTQIFWETKLKERGFTGGHTDPYHPAFDLEITMDAGGIFAHYRRALRFDTGEVSVTWEAGGHAYARALFVSRADDVVVMRLRADAPALLAAAIALQVHKACKGAYMSGKRTQPEEKAPITFHAAAEDGWLTFTGAYEDGNQYGGLARVVVTGGECAVDGEWLRATGADEIVILLKLFANEPADGALPRLRVELAALPVDYDILLHRHVGIHGEIYSRMALDLDAGDARALTNDELLMQAYDGTAPAALIERMARFGRYLLLSSSRPGGWPANLQGVWNGDYDPAWSADYHNDENIQMNYWQALPGNMAEAALPYFAYYESMLDDYRRNAKALYNCRGILAPVAQSTHGMIYPHFYASWTGGAGWLAQLFYDYWLFTGDRDFLAQHAVPFLREVAMFYEDFVVEDAEGALHFIPANSPENTPGNLPGWCPVTMDATMEVAIAKEVLTNLCAAYDELGLPGEETQRWRRMSAKLPAYQINEDGAMREWLHPDFADNYHHRHQSHIYPLFPGYEITEENAPELYEAMRVAVEKRFVVGLTSQTGWSLAHMANIFARLGEGDRALECLELLARSCTGPNLFTYHNDWRAQGATLYGGHGSQPPFQIDANLGFTAAVQEMLVFAIPGLVKVLPALPSSWTTGRVAGLRCRGGIEVSLAWEMELSRVQVALRSARARQVTLKFPGEVIEIRADRADLAITANDLGAAYRVIALPADEDFSLDVKLAPAVAAKV